MGKVIVTYKHDYDYGYTVRYINGIPLTFVRWGS